MTNISFSLFLSYRDFFLKVNILLSLSFFRTSFIISRDIFNFDNVIIINEQVIASIASQVIKITKDDVIIRILTSNIKNNNNLLFLKKLIEKKA